MWWKRHGRSSIRCCACLVPFINTPAEAAGPPKRNDSSRAWVDGRRRQSDPTVLGSGCRVTPEVLIGDRALGERTLVSDFQRAAVEAIAARGTCLVALSEGSIAQLFFPSLARLVLDWSLVDFFWVDERAVPPDHPDSNFAEADRL